MRAELVVQWDFMFSRPRSAALQTDYIFLPCVWQGTHWGRRSSCDRPISMWNRPCTGRLTVRFDTWTDLVVPLRDCT